MAVHPLMRLLSNNVLNTLRDVGYVVNQILPEQYRFSESNKAGMVPHPIAIACGEHGKLLFIDCDPLKCSSRLFEADLHNPVRVKDIKSSLPDVRSLCYIKSMGAAVFCGSGTSTLHVVDLEDNIKLRCFRLRDRASVVAELEKRSLSCSGTVKQFKERLESSLQKEQRSYQAEGKSSKYISLDKDIKRSAICNFSDDIVACSSKFSRKVDSIAVHSNGHFLCGTANVLCTYPNGCK